MPTFHLKTPDGAEYEVDAPDENAAVAALSHPSVGGTPAGAVPPAGQPTTLGDYGAMATKGASFGLADRIGAAGDVVMSKLGVLPPERGDYAANLEGYRKTISDAEKRHPIGAPVTETLAGLAAPVGVIGAAAKGTGLWLRALYGALAGGGMGAVQGAASTPDLTDVPQAAKDTAIGGATGATLGMSLPLAATGIGRAAGGLMDALGGKVVGIPRAASGHLVDAVTADTPALVQQEAARLGPDAMMADLGPALQGKAQGAALNSDDARSIMFGALKSRNLDTNARLGGDVNGALGPAQSPQAVTDTILGQRKAVHTALPSAFKAAPPVDVTGVLADIGQRLDKAVGPEKAVLNQAKSFLMEQQPRPMMNANGTPLVQNGKIVTEMRPVPVQDAEKLHNAKMALDTLIDYGDSSLGVPPGAVSKAQGSVADVRRSLNDQLRDQVPDYADIMDQSSGLARQVDAIETGTGILDSGKTALRPDDLAMMLHKLAQPERDALRTGARGEIDRQLGTKANDLVALKGTLQGEGGWNTDKLGQVFGQPKATALVDAVDREGRFRDTFNKVVENSQTAQRTAAAGAMKPVKPTDVPLVGPGTTALGLLATMAKKGVAQPLWNAVANRDPAASYSDMARVLTAQGSQRDAHLAAILDAMSRRGKNGARAAKAGDASAVVAGLLGMGALNGRRLQSR